MSTGSWHRQGPAHPREPSGAGFPLGVVMFCREKACILTNMTRLRQATGKRKSEASSCQGWERDFTTSYCLVSPNQIFWVLSPRLVGLDHPRPPGHGWHPHAALQHGALATPQPRVAWAESYVYISIANLYLHLLKHEQSHVRVNKQIRVHVSLRLHIHVQLRILHMYICMCIACASHESMSTSAMHI